MGLWDLFKGIFKNAEDTRPDPEDKDVYKHFDKIAKKLEFEKNTIQIRKGNRAEQDALGLGHPPAGIEWYMDVYESPLGPGYQVVYLTERNGVLYQKIVNVGPETFRDRDWEIATTPVVV
jgi:hypothetical protein